MALEGEEGGVILTSVVFLSAAGAGAKAPTEGGGGDVGGEDAIMGLGVCCWRG